MLLCCRRLKRYLKPILSVALRTRSHGATAQCSIGFQPVSVFNVCRRASPVPAIHRFVYKARVEWH
jgi:hypothetical protein